MITVYSVPRDFSWIENYKLLKVVHPADSVIRFTFISNVEISQISVLLISDCSLHDINNFMLLFVLLFYVIITPQSTQARLVVSRSVETASMWKESIPQTLTYIAKIKRFFWFKFFSVNMSKSVENCGFGHIYLRNPW